MRALQRVIVVGALALVLAGGPALAQNPPAQNPPAQNPPAQNPPAQPQPPAPKPYPEGAKIAYVDLNKIAQLSAEGKAAASKVQEYEKKKLAEIQEKNKQIEEMRKKLEEGGNVMNEAARAQLQKDLDRAARELQFMQETAQAERAQLEQELNSDFLRKLNPIIQQVSEEKGLHFLFSIRDAGALWWNTGLDLSDEVIKRLDASAKAPQKQ